MRGLDHGACTLVRMYPGMDSLRIMASQMAGKIMYGSSSSSS